MVHENLIRSTLLGVAFGDAYGADTEFMKFKDIKEQHGAFGPEFPRPALVTDDTQMSLSVLNALGVSVPRDENGSLDISQARKQLVEEYVAWYHDERNNASRAPGKACLTATEKLAVGLGWQDATQADSKGCGTVMRSGVIGIIPNLTEDEVARLSTLSAVLTHGHPAGVYSAVVASLLVREIALGELDPTRVATRALEIAIDQMLEGEYDHEILGTVWKQAGYESPDSYHYNGWNDVVFLLRKAKNNVSAIRRDEEWDTDPCSITGEGWTADEALATAVLITTALGDDPGLALRRAATTNGDSDSIGAIVGAFVGATGFDWSKGWQRALEEDYYNEIDLLSVTVATNGRATA